MVDFLWTELARLLGMPIPNLTPAQARRVFSARTGVNVPMTTFYRWLESGSIRSIRVGFRIYIRWPHLQRVIERCMEGERIDQ